MSVAVPIGNEYPSVPQSKSPSVSQPHDTVSTVSRAAVEIVSCAAPTSASVSEVPQSPTGQEGHYVHGEVEHGTPEAGSADDESASDDQEDDDDEEFVVRWNRIRREGSNASDTVVDSVTLGPDEVDVGESFPRPERASDLSTGPESTNNTISRGRSLTLPSPSPRPRVVSPTVMKNRRSSVQFTPRYGLEADGHHPLIANEMQSSLASESAEDPDSHLRSDLSASEDLPEPPTLPPNAAERASSPKSVDTPPHPVPFLPFPTPEPAPSGAAIAHKVEPVQPGALSTVPALVPAPAPLAVPLPPAAENPFSQDLARFNLSPSEKVLEFFSCALYPKRGMLTHGR